MRKKIDQQLKFWGVRISEIKIPLNSRDELSPILMALQHLCVTPELKAEAFRILEEKTRRIQELLEALLSSERIERLTGNPMLLTTLALVKRKVGKLPNRRNKLYAEAVQVLLNWNPRHYDAIILKLGDVDKGVRLAVIKALRRLGDKQAEARLILLLDDQDPGVCEAAAGALIVLGADRGTIALTEFLDHRSSEMRKAGVKELVRLGNKPKERTLLSHDLDWYLWIDPGVPIMETRIADAARELGVTNQEARSLYEEIAADFHLKFA